MTERETKAAADEVAVRNLRGELVAKEQELVARMPVRIGQGSMQARVAEVCSSCCIRACEGLQF